MEVNTTQGKQTTMNVSLPEALRIFVENEVRERGYTSASEFVRELLRQAKEKREQTRSDTMPRETASSNGINGSSAARAAIAEIRRIRVGNTLGPDVSIAELIRDGRR